MSVWLVRSGKHGEDEDFALENGFASVRWNNIGDLSDYESKSGMRSALEELFPKDTPAKISNTLGQLWAFSNRIEVGDIVVRPSKFRSEIALGVVTGNYRFLDGRQLIPVDWKRKDVPRSAFGQDLLYSFGAFMTVCKIERNDAEQRVKAILEGKPDPYMSGTLTTAQDRDADDSTASPLQFDLEENAFDQLRQMIEARFKGHSFTRLIEAILKEQGYFTYSSPPGPDGGVDVIAGKGGMGFDSPRLCVQVKSGGAVDDITVRELEGVMGRMQADRGLFVSWNGFKSSVTRKTADLFFKVRLWDSNRVIKALLEVYDRLPDDIQAEIPLKRIWVPVLEDE